MRGSTWDYLGVPLFERGREWLEYEYPITLEEVCADATKDAIYIPIPGSRLSGMVPHKLPEGIVGPIRGPRGYPTGGAVYPYERRSGLKHPAR